MPENTFKDKILSTFKRLGVETALVTYKVQISEGMKKFFASHTPEQWKKFIDNAEPLILPTEFYKFLEHYKDMLNMYKTERICEILIENIYDTRPDLVNVVLESKNENAKLWFYRCVELIIDRVNNPMKYMRGPISEPELTSRVTCDKCKGVFIVPTEMKDKLLHCPFCGEGNEKPVKEE